jgi:hypothetical protein
MGLLLSNKQYNMLSVEPAAKPWRDDPLGGPDHDATEYETQENLILGNLEKFYHEHPDKLKKMVSIIHGEAPSLRIIEWFVTNYAKEYYVWYMVPLYPDAPGSGEMVRFKVYDNYKSNLNSFLKERFDPCCRGNRKYIPYNDDLMIETTVGQLKYFKWLFENRVLEYIEANYEAIERDMKQRNNTSRKKRPVVEEGANNVKTRKRREISTSATKCIKKENIPMIITFG